MKKLYFSLLTLLTWSFACVGLNAADGTSMRVEALTRDGYSLHLVHKNADFPVEIKGRMIDTFFKVYPKLCADFNPAATKTVVFVLDGNIPYPAYASDGRIHFNGDWMRKAPGNDIDIITHETMHLVQAYPNGNPGWVTEGIADYVRYKYGVDNKSNNWSLPAYSDKQHYTNAYRITARFFDWLEQNGHAGLVKKLDQTMRAQKYTDAFWKENTGKTIDELWADYAKANKPDAKPAPSPSATPRTLAVTVSNGQFQLVQVFQENSVSDALREKMTKTFFAVYPKLAEKFNHKAATKVTFHFQDFDGVAYTELRNAKVVFNTKWMTEKPGNDIDVITHELTHVVQAYPSANPSWVTEGIADYARYAFGVDNKGAGWALPEFSPNQKHTDSYRVTGRFFAWLEQNKADDILVKVDKAMRAGTYSDNIWKEITGQTIDELWADYAKNPQLKTK